MKQKLNQGIGCIIIFLIWTILVCCVDLQPVGPKDSIVGFSGMNQFVHQLLGVHMWLYVITDWLSLIPVGFMMGFAVLGLVQWIRRTKLTKVDKDILMLGCFYLIVLSMYLFFEEFVINYRPVLINGYLEASYPSSTTLLVMTVMGTAKLQLKHRINNETLNYCVCIGIYIFSKLMVIGRLVSGVHWFSDIVGSMLLSVGLIKIYEGFAIDRE